MQVFKHKALGHLNDNRLKSTFGTDQKVPHKLQRLHQRGVYNPSENMPLSAKIPLLTGFLELIKVITIIILRPEAIQTPISIFAVLHSCTDTDLKIWLVNKQGTP